MRVGSQVSVRLIHTTHVEDRLTSTTVYYRVQKTLLDRPESGERTGWLRCAACGNFVGLRIMCAARTRTRRRRALYVFVVSVLAAVALVRYVGALPDEGVPGWTITGLAVLGVLLFCAVVGSAAQYVVERGVYVAKGRGNGPHRTQPFGFDVTVTPREYTPAEFIDEEF